MTVGNQVVIHMVNHSTFMGPIFFCVLPTGLKYLNTKFVNTVLLSDTE